MNLEQKLKALCTACAEAGRNLQALADAFSHVADQLEALQTATLSSLVDSLEEAYRFGKRGDQQGFLEFRESLALCGPADWMDLGIAYESGRAARGNPLKASNAPLDDDTPHDTTNPYGRAMAETTP